MKKFYRVCQASSILLFLLQARLISHAQTPFSCQDQVSYLTRNASSTATTLPYTLYATNLVTGVQTALGAVRASDNTNLRVNAIGYNTIDNFIWGSQPGTSNILRIGADGVATSFPVTGLPANAFTAGDVDAAGNLYLYVPSATTIYKINLAGPAYSAVAITVTGSNLEDFSVNADGTKIYGASAGNGNMVTYNITGTTSTRVVANIGFSAASFNTFLDSRGNMFFQSQGTGNVYLANPTFVTVANARMVYDGSAMTNADGAQCRTASVYSNAQAPFGCVSGQGYVQQSRSERGDCTGGDEDLYTINVQTGSYEEVYPDMTANIEYGILNNLGYNPKDGYLWAYRHLSNQLARIGSDTTIQFFPIDGLLEKCSGGLNSGDFDRDGIFYLMDGNEATTIHKINLNPSSPGYGKYLGSISISISGGLTDLTDMAVNPADGMLYGVSNSRNLIRIDPSTGVATNLGATSIAGTTNIVIAMIDITGTLYCQASNSATVYRISDVQKFNGSTVPTATVFRSNSPTTTNGDGTFCPQTLLAGVSLSGNVWNDGNGDRIKTESNTVTDNAAERLTVYLLDENGTIIAKSDVASDGTWAIDLVPPGEYTISLSNDDSQEPGTVKATILGTLPDANWVHTGINFGNTPGAPGSSSGAVAVGTTSIANLNFGLDALPDSDDKSGVLTKQPTPDSFIPLDGSVANAQELAGSDLEDQPGGGNLSGKTVAITSLPTNGELWYNNQKIEFGKDGINPPSPENPFVITNLIPSQLSIKLTGTGYSSTTFNYAYVDAAGVQDPTPASYTLDFKPLPVTIASFSAQSEGSNVQIGWVTSWESNSEYFAVEYSTTGKEWKELGRRQAQGTSNKEHTYQFLHENPASRQNLYRLKAVDADGTFAYSSIRSVNIELAALTFVFPNPASDVLMIRQEAALPRIDQIQILTTGGEVVHTLRRLPSKGIDVGKLPNGTYLLCLRFADGQKSVQKFTVVK